MSMKKFQLINADTKTIIHPNTGLPVKLFRIYALKTIQNGRIHIPEGSIGGYVRSEANLNNDPEDNSWVCHEGMVFDDAFVTNGGIVMQKAAAFGNAIVDHTMVQDHSRVYGSCKIYNSQLSGKTDVYGTSFLDFCNLYNSCKVSGNAKLKNCKLYHGAFVTDNSVLDNCELYDQSRVYGESNLINCKLSSAVLIRDQVLVNETISREIELQQSYPSIQGQF